MNGEWDDLKLMLYSCAKNRNHQHPQPPQKKSFSGTGGIRSASASAGGFQDLKAENILFVERGAGIVSYFPREECDAATRRP